MIILDINYQTKVPQKFERLFKKTARIAFQQLKIKRSVRISLVFMGQIQMKRLNKKYRHHNNITNVLAFPEINEILICYQKAVSEAKKQNHQLSKHLVWLFVHGLLHLFGYDHQTPAQEGLMRGLEFRILEKIC